MDPAADLPYVLGHSDRELARLRAQARLLEPTTRQFLVEAGIEPGMRVLDVGSGAGDVAFLAAELVGSSGEVVGTDVASAAVATASSTAQSSGRRNVSFREGDPGEMEFERPFDAVVGRYFLPFQADPSMALRRIARHARSGGVVVFHEPDWTAVRSVPRAPLYEQACAWISKTTKMSGTSWDFADRAHATFVDAGLADPTMRMQTFIAGGSRAEEWIHALADIVETLVPAMIRLGVAGEADVGPATFRERLLHEVSTIQSVIFGRSELGVWSKVR